MKDLEIRGAGNLLGAEQSGFMNSVGFDLYCKLLAEAVEELQGKRAEVGLPGVIVDPGVTLQHVELLYAVTVTVAPLLVLPEMGIPFPAAPLWSAVNTTRVNAPPALAFTCGSGALLISLMRPC